MKPTQNYMKIKLKSTKLVSIRKELKDAMVEFGEQQKKLVDIDTEHKKMAHKINRIKEKGQKELDKVLKKQYKMKEFDYFTDYEALDNENLECNIQNIFDDAFGNPEEAKKRLRKDKKDKRGMWAEKSMYVGH